MNIRVSCKFENGSTRNVCYNVILHSSFECVCKVLGYFVSKILRGRGIHFEFYYFFPSLEKETGE